MALGIWDDWTLHVDLMRKEPAWPLPCLDQSSWRQLALTSTFLPRWSGSNGTETSGEWNLKHHEVQCSSGQDVRSKTAKTTL